MITTRNPDTLRNAVFGIGGVRQNPPGTVIEYWRGPTDFAPKGQRREVFDMAHKLYQSGACLLFQEPVEKTDDGYWTYSYRAMVM